MHPHILTIILVLVFYGGAAWLAAGTANIILGRRFNERSWTILAVTTLVLAVLAGLVVYDAVTNHNGSCDKLFGGQRKCDLRGKINGALVFDVPFLALLVALPVWAIAVCARAILRMIAVRQQ
jgi:cytochrome bd-type quinol oxidase subunit 2